jgi:hypothetical protein
MFTGRPERLYRKQPMKHWLLRNSHDQELAGGAFGLLNLTHTGDSTPFNLEIRLQRTGKLDPTLDPNRPFWVPS